VVLRGHPGAARQVAADVRRRKPRKTTTAAASVAVVTAAGNGRNGGKCNSGASCSCSSHSWR